MEYLNFISKNENETKNFARTFAKKLESDSKLSKIIILTGDLGSGKTKFVEGFLSYYGLENEISSPTFTIVNEYKSKEINIFHFDVYRLNDLSEFYEIGGDEYFDKGICLIEWGELIKDALPKNYIHITFSRNSDNENYRNLKINLIKN